MKRQKNIFDKKINNNINYKKVESRNIENKPGIQINKSKIKTNINISNKMKKRKMQNYIF